MRVLFLTHRLPYAPNRGDRVRAFHLLRAMSGYSEVDLVSLVHDEDEASHAADLRSETSSVSIARVPRLRNAARAFFALPSNRPLTHVLLSAPGLSRRLEELVRSRRPSVVLSYCTGMAPLAALPALRDLPMVLDMVDVDSAKWSDLAQQSSPPRSWIFQREARRLRDFEREVASRAFATLVVTPRESAELRVIAPDARIEVIQNGVDAGALRRPDTRAPSLECPPAVVFCGVMDYAPNVQGAVWLARQVWPLVRQARPDARLEIVGSRPAGAVRQLANPGAGIQVTGRVDDVRTHLWNARASAAPLFTARGVQNKVLEAVAAGLTAVVTPVVMEGLPEEVRPACRVADSPFAFAAALIDLLSSPGHATAAPVDLSSLTWERRLAPLRKVLEDASISGPDLPGRAA